MWWQAKTKARCAVTASANQVQRYAKFSSYIRMPALKIPPSYTGTFGATMKIYYFCGKQHPMHYSTSPADGSRAPGSGAPLFSIITVTYNAESTVGRTIGSVASQTCRLFEHLIIDGDSSDGTLDIAERMSRDYGARILSSPDQGIYDAMNKGMAEAKGDYLIFLNAGDKFHSPDTLQLLADAIMDNDYPGVVYGQTDIVDNSGRRICGRHLQAPETLTLDSFRNGMVVCHQAFVPMRRIASNYDLRWRFSADYEWCVRVLQHSRRNVCVDAVTVDYLQEGTTTRNLRRSLMERYRIMCYYFGFWSTTLRHIKFLGRFLKRRHDNPSSRQ